MEMTLLAPLNEWQMTAKRTSRREYIIAIALELIATPDLSSLLQMSRQTMSRYDMSTFAHV